MQMLQRLQTAIAAARDAKHFSGCCYYRRLHTGTSFLKRRRRACQLLNQMQDHVQLRFKAKEAMAIATGREKAEKFQEASEAYTVAAEFCSVAKKVAIAAGADAKAMRDAEVPSLFAFG